MISVVFILLLICSTVHQGRLAPSYLLTVAKLLSRFLVDSSIRIYL